MAQVYRKSALEKLSSPEQLDKALRLSSPLSWLVLIGLTLIIIVVVIWSFTGKIPVTLTVYGIVSSPQSTITVYADEPGTVRAIQVVQNSEIHLGDVLMVYQNGEQAKEVRSDQVGYISEILVNNGDSVYQGAELFRVSPKITNTDADVVVCYVPLGQKNIIKKEMPVQVYLDGLDSQNKGDMGHMEARVISIDSRAATTNGMACVLGGDSNNLVAKLQNEGPVVAVTCEFIPAATESGYYWTNAKGATVKVRNGSSVTVKIITDEIRPIKKLFSDINRILGVGE